ncbi:hypothetical protein FRB94_009106 [Tulasnella sp. JGI-2019a]|nr:hypothetical protein FRB94_009106 [Tulasnella sp. JGI-2019a]KAG9012324.1 hypothetical protein FRB93_001746 [Tulasnella sp. JGI-2019a]
MTTSTLDHIIHISPPGKLRQAIDHFEGLGFVVLPGGQHADGMTSNALVIFNDGVYLELIAFRHEVDYYPVGTPERERRESHWWASKSPGWIDWANLGIDHEVANTINNRSGGLVEYHQPQEGGRTKPDGTELKWRVTFPDLVHERGSLPFFCEDVTPRDRRVPLEPHSNTQHPCGATGISHIKLRTSKEHVERLSKQLDIVMGNQSELVFEAERHWTLHTPVMDSQSGPARIILIASEAMAVGMVAELIEVGFYVAVEPLHPSNNDSDKRFGAITWCPPPGS